VIGDDADRNIVVFIFLVGPAADFFDETDDADEEVGVVVARHPLDHGSQALQSHPRVDVRFRQGGQLP
jgi:hypothetical protein